MTMALLAPFDAPEDVIVLPSPAFKNEFIPGESLIYKRSMTGSRRTYVKKRGIIQLKLPFTSVSNEKLLELHEFYANHVGEIIRVLDWVDRIWEMRFDQDGLVGSTTGPFKPIDDSDSRAGGFTGMVYEHGDCELAMIGRIVEWPNA